MQDDGAALDVLAGVPAVGAALYAGRDKDVAILDAAVLLHEDGVRPSRHGRAGEDADRLARRRRPIERMSRRHAPGDSQPRLVVGVEVVVKHRVAVDGRVVVRRDRPVGNDVGGEDTATRRAQRHRFPLDHRVEPLGQQRECFVRRHQLTAEGETVVR